jgi:thiamine-monophosphate kinase
MTNCWELGWKALAVNLSDIAAMGGVPVGFTVSLGIPTQTISVESLDDFYKGATSLGNTFGIELLGGDTSQGGERLIISVSIVGEAAKSEVVYRDGGKDGDILYVTGFLGEAALGLKLLERGINRTEIENLLKRYLCPTPRVREGRLLAERKIPNAMIDISDGLLADLHHIVRQSGLRGEIELPLVPLSSELKDKATRYGLDPLNLALGGGDDYELLFCVSPEKSEAVAQLREELSCPVTRIGKLSGGVDRIMVKDDKGCSKEVQPFGYDHFKTT